MNAAAAVCMELAANSVSDVNAADIAAAAGVDEAAAAAVELVGADSVADSVAAVSGVYVAVMAMAAVAVGDAEGSTGKQRNRTSPPSQAQTGAERSSCNRRIQQSRNIRDD